MGDHSNLQTALDRLAGEQPTSIPMTAPLSKAPPQLTLLTFHHGTLQSYDSGGYVTINLALFQKQQPFLLKALQHYIVTQVSAAFAMVRAASSEPTLSLKVFLS